MQPDGMPPRFVTVALTAMLASRFLDPDERVRAMACKVVHDMAQPALARLQPAVLDGVLGRCMDKKVR